MSIMQSTIRDTAPAEAGYSLVELMIAMLVTTTIMGVTMTGLSDAIKTNDAVLQITGMNNTLRTGMDLMIRDLLQAGSGLPKGHVLSIPSGGLLIRRPGPPGTTYTTTAGDLNLPAVIPGAGRGPEVNGVDTDIITILTADNNFTDIGVTAVTSTSVDVDPADLVDLDPDDMIAPDIGTGRDRVIEGQLMMVLKGSTTTLVQVTGVNAAANRITFATGDSLNLNQDGATIPGSLRALNAVPPIGAAAPAATRLTRIRMISYYLDNTTDPGHPRLVRRINNGHQTTFNNELGTAVAFDVENLRFSYDLNDGSGNPAGVRFVDADFADYSPTQIRKVNVTLATRSQNASVPQSKVYRNTLTSQVALRGMALVNDYQD